MLLPFSQQHRSRSLTPYQLKILGCSHFLGPLEVMPGRIIIFLINEAAVLTLLSFCLQTVQFYTNMKTTFSGNKTKHKFFPIVVKRFHIV